MRLSHWQVQLEVGAGPASGPPSREGPGRSGRRLGVDNLNLKAVWKAWPGASSNSREDCPPNPGPAGRRRAGPRELGIAMGSNGTASGPGCAATGCILASSNAGPARPGRWPGTGRGRAAAAPATPRLGPTGRLGGEPQGQSDGTRSLELSVGGCTFKLAGRGRPGGPGLSRWY